MTIEDPTVAQITAPRVDSGTPTARELAEEKSYALFRAELQARTVIGNLIRLRDRPLPYALPLHQVSERSGTAIIVGAGPSLSPQLDALKAAADHATIFAVNGSLPALRKAAIRADWVLARESLDQSHHFVGGGFDRVALDLTANPLIYDAAEREGASVHWFAAGSTMTWQVADALEARPLMGGTAALTAAVQLAAELGAARIVIVGVDLAVLDGVAYDPQSAYGAVKGEAGADGMIRFSNTENWDTGARNAGVRAESKTQIAEMVPCWDGVVRPGMHAEQIRWLGVFARRAAREGIDVVCTSPRGSRKEGWRHEPDALAAIVARWDDNADDLEIDRRVDDVGESEPLDPALVAAFLDRVRADAAWYLDPRPVLERGALASTCLIETMAAGATVRAMLATTAGERLVRMHAGYREQAAWVRERLA